MLVEPRAALNDEWLEADGLGGFASGTVSGLRTRRYHGLLLSAAAPPQDRRLLVQGFVGRLETSEGRAELWPQAYCDGYVRERDATRTEFSLEPWPRWQIHTTLGVSVVIEVFVPRGVPAVVLSFRLGRDSPQKSARLSLRPLLSGRDFHALHAENPAFQWGAEQHGHALSFAPYPGVPSIQSLSNARFRSDPDWYRRFYYAEEAARGLDSVEDLASPGVLELELGLGLSSDSEQRECVWLLQADVEGALELEQRDPLALVASLRQRERERRSALRDPLERAASAYLVKRGSGSTIIAGYPWFGDWGRDTFIAVRGLCLARGDFATARQILCEWAGAVSRGMLPNRFADNAAEAPEYNSADASLWFVLATSELLGLPAARHALPLADRRKLEQSLLQIVTGYARGTRYGIRRTDDGLLAAGEPGLQLTWMDAKVGDWVVTPRVGKPVEIQALWIHALDCAARIESSFAPLAETARRSFAEKFWNEARGMLFDVVDVDHVEGTHDDACRPNQIFAAGGLPVTLLSADRCRKVVDAVERELWTPLGLRSLGRSHTAYRAHYAGGVRERDGAYHQGTVWPWLTGAFVEAWVKSRGGTRDAKVAAEARFVAPLRAHLHHAGLGHVSEVADGDAPHTPRGCPFQAWSIAELLRLERVVLA